MTRFRSKARWKLTCVTIAVTFAIAVICAARADDNSSQEEPQTNASPKSARERLEAMPADELLALTRKQERFAKMSPEQQGRIRDLHRRLQSHARSTELSSLMGRYASWLRNLPAGQRAELLSLPHEERLAKIQDTLKKQEEERFRRLAANQLNADDYSALVAWIRNLAANRKDQIISDLPESMKEHVSKYDQEGLQRFLYFAVLRSADKLELKSEDFELLTKELSSSARDLLDEAKTQEQKVLIIREWLKVAWMSRTRFSKSEPISEEKLMEYYESLDNQAKERLKLLSAENMRRELESMYRNRSWMRERGGSFRRPRSGSGSRRGEEGSSRGGSGFGRGGFGGFRPGGEPNEPPPAGSSDPDQSGDSK